LKILNWTLYFVLPESVGLDLIAKMQDFNR
jgi:hypothetical protein